MGVFAVRLLRVKIPPEKVRGEQARLLCDYDIEGGNLYTVKWFKGDDEFFRYLPKDRNNPFQTFEVPGVIVDVSIVLISFIVFKSS